MTKNKKGKKEIPVKNSRIKKERRNNVTKNKKRKKP